ncbi:hypothetical protein DPQ33_01255 [Oceanidesulfovibrio indonesiensis]|uniref:Uncharacterized protein n=1 Tax=Oceanidesulfovibrio indonesiensis TaxID=54767 RepID=A0A7M3MJD6_9BACT|nr:hypothetical protein DPQ33_01255 [Oceanidesulfovibrio indonesiensis]
MATPAQDEFLDVNERLEDLGFYRYDTTRGTSAYVKMLGEDDPGRFVVVADTTGRNAPGGHSTPVLVATYGDELTATAVTEYPSLEAFLRRLEN